jgi:hypothetical protein
VLPLYIAERMGEVPFLHSGVHSPVKTSMKVFGGNYLRKVKEFLQGMSCTGDMPTFRWYAIESNTKI